MSKHLVLKNISKSFGSLVALDDVNLTVEPGEFVCFLGPSGCGKTTLLRIITGFEFQTSGDISYGDRNLNNVIPQKRDFGIVFQSYALFPNMTVHQNIAFGLIMRKMPQKLIDRRVDEMLELMGLTEWKEHYPSQLSGGQQQRVALARAIAIKPNVLLLDEPLSALDAKIRVRLRAVIKRLQQDLGITMIYVTHDQEEALSMSDRVVVMRSGQFRQVGSPWEIYKNPKSSFIAEFVGTSNFFEGIKKGDSVTYGRFSLKVSEIDTVASGKIYLAIRPEDIEIVGITVDKESCVASNIVDVRVELVTFLGPIVSITVNLEGKDLLVDIAQKEFAKQPITIKDTLHLYFPPDTFHVYSEIFKKLI